jgi:hypothetical protein
LSQLLFELVRVTGIQLSPWPCFIRGLAQLIVAAREPSFKHAKLKKYQKR